MIFSKAQQEFQIRYYLWATSEFEKEIDESFPRFRSFKTGAVWGLYQFMQQLDRNEQLTLAHSLLKRFHPNAVRALGESCSDEEKSLRSRLDEFRLAPSGLDVEIGGRRRAGEKIKFMSKRKLLKAMEAKFQSAFGDQCIESEQVLEGDPSLRFRMKCCGWILQTNFWFGRRESVINYSHLIASPTRIKHHMHPEITAPAMLMDQGISFSAWLGITSQIQWEYLMDADVEPVCADVIKLCGHFFEVLPKLLKGLEFEKITEK